jgi:diacylglycerol O-acyltransferase
MQTMTGMDAAFLYLETPTAHMHVIGVVILDPSTAPESTKDFGLEQIREAIAARIHLIPPFRRRAVPPPGKIDHPVWIEDPEFDLDAHLTRSQLPSPVTWEDLERFTGEFAGIALERDRPLWAIAVVEGLEDGCVAMVAKLHHSIMDGSAGGELMASLFDLTSEAGSVAPPTEPWVADVLPSSPALVFSSVTSFLARQKDAPAAVARTLSGLGRSARTWLAQRAKGQGSPVTAPKSALNSTISSRRSVSLTKVSMTEVREIKEAFGTTINDVVLAASGTSLRRYLLSRDQLPPDALVVAVPVNARSREPGEDLGNRVSNMMVSLPLTPEDPLERLQAVHENALASKELQSAMGTQSLQEMTAFASPSVMTVGARMYSGLKLANYHRPIFNLIISNVPGPPIDLFCAGAVVRAIFPMGPVMEGTGSNITVLSQGHHLNVGVMACPDVVPDISEIGQGFVSAVAELLELARQAG